MPRDAIIRLNEATPRATNITPRHNIICDDIMRYFQDMRRHAYAT